MEDLLAQRKATLARKLNFCNIPDHSPTAVLLSLGIRWYGGGKTLASLGSKPHSQGVSSFRLRGE